MLFGHNLDLWSFLPKLCILGFFVFVFCMHDFRVRVQLWWPPHSFKQFGLIGSRSAFDQSHAKLPLVPPKDYFCRVQNSLNHNIWSRSDCPRYNLYVCGVSKLLFILFSLIFFLSFYLCTMKCCFGMCKKLVGGWQTFCWLGERRKKTHSVFFFLLSSHMHTGECALRCLAVKSREIKTWVWVMSLPAWQEAAV